MGANILKKMLLLIAFFQSWPALADESEKLFHATKNLAENGHAEAQYNLGMFYNNGIGTSVDIEKAFEMFVKSAASNHPLGAYKLGCYYAGQGQKVVHIDNELALKYKLIAANAGYSLAQYDVGLSYAQKGKYQEALEWWTASAKQGWPQSILMLHIAYRDGLGVEKDPTLSYSYLKLAAIIGTKTIDPSTQESIDLIRNALTTEQQKEAMKVISDFYYEPTELTKKARRGVTAAQEYVEQHIPNQ